MGLPGVERLIEVPLESLSCHVLLQQEDEFVWANQTAREVLGLGPEDSEDLKVKVADVMLGAYPLGKAVDLAGADSRFECILMGSGGMPRNITGTLQEWTFRGAPARLVIAIERTGSLYDEMRGHATFLEELLDSAPEAIAIVHRGKILHVNHEFTRLFGYSAQESVGRNLDEMLVPEGRMHESEMLALALEETGRGFLETVRRTKAGELVDVSVLAAPVRIGGDQVGVFVSYRDIRQQKQVEARLQHDALHDSLTGLANRVLFLDRLQLTMTRMVRRPDRNFAIMFLDLDGFKQVNDTKGHASGDALLLKTGARLQGCLRPQDSIARLGGDEFAILLDEIVSPLDATGVAERIQQSVCQPVEVFGQFLNVSVSIGIAFGSPEYTDAKQIMRDADVAMYRAKANGKARYEVYDHSMHLHATVRRQMEVQLREALANDEFEVWYQPVYSLRDGLMESAEALLRWRHPERGYVPLGEFMRLAEDTGLILEIGAVVLSKACAQMKTWLLQRPRCPLCLNVNLSPTEFSQPGLLGLIAQVLAETGLDASRLRVEITEMAVNQDPDAAVMHVQRMNDMGIEVSLDNFGAGLASMSNLLRLPVQRLKLDRRLTSYLPALGRQAAFIETIFALGRVMQMRMQADGIETEAQLVELQRYGCELGQGHLFAAALDPAAMEAMLDRPRLPERSRTIRVASNRAETVVSPS